MNQGDSRDLLVLAGSGVIAAWLIEVVREASGLFDPPLEFGFCDGDEVLPDLGRRGGPPRIVIIGGANRAVIDVIRSRSCFLVGLVDDPVDCVRFLAERGGVSLLEALRVQTKYVCAHEFLLDYPAVRLIRRGTPEPARTVIGGLLQQVGGNPDPVQRSALLDRFGGTETDGWSLETALAATVHGYRDIGALSAHVSAEEVGIIRRVLSPLLLGALTRDVEFRWLRPVFLSGDDPARTFPPVADVTGAARIIFFGPYFHLASGDWTVTLMVAFSDLVKGTSFHLRVLCMQDTLAQVVLKPLAGGAFEGEFHIRHVAPERYIEVQFSTLEGMIEGHVAIGEMRFVRTLSPPGVSQRGAGAEGLTRRKD